MLIGGAIFASAKIETPASFIYLTWESDGWAPISYSGKIIVVKDSVVKLTVQPLIYSAGAYLDPAQLNINWLLDEQLKNSGLGLTTFRFQVPSFPDVASHAIKVQVFKDSVLLGEKTLDITVASPTVLLVPVETGIRIKNNSVEANSDITIEALPYFFSIKDPSQLNVYWFVDGEQTKSTAQDKLSFMVSHVSGQTQVKALLERNDNVFVRQSGILMVGFSGL